MPSGEFKNKGTFAEVVLPALLVHAVNIRFTGMFRAERESIIKVIYFKEGEIAFASSNQPSDRLGEVLIKRGQLTREQLDMAMSKLEANVSLGRMLVELGYLSPKELLAGAKTQVEEILYSLNAWKDGNFEFTQGPLPPRIVDLKLNTRQVIFQCILQVEDRRWVLEQIGSMEAVFAPETELHDAITSMRLEPEVQQVIANIDGNNTMRDLCARSRLDEFTVTKIVAALHMLNLTRVAVQEGEGGGEALARFGEEPDETTANDQTVIKGSFNAGETVPGISTGGFFDETEAGTTQAARPEDAMPRLPIDEPEEEELEEGEATVQLPPHEPPPEAEEEEEASTEEMAFEEEEEAPEEEEGEFEAEPRRSLLIPGLLAVVGVAAIGGALWYFLFRGAPEGSATPTPAATVAQGARTPRPGATAAASATRPAASATPTAAAMGSPTAVATLKPLTSPGFSPTPAPTGLAAGSPIRPTPSAVLTPVSGRTPPPTPAPTLAAASPTRTVVAMATPTPAKTGLPTPPPATPRPSAVAGHTPLPSPSARPTTVTMGTPPLGSPAPTRIAQATPRPTFPSATPRVGLPAITPRPTPASKVPPIGRPTPAPASTPTHAPAGGREVGLPAGPSTDQGRAKLSASQYREAAQAFHQATRSVHGYSLQLEIVCQESSIHDGLGQAQGNAEYFILPFSLRGRTCYRVLWGVFDSRAAAEQASSSVPAFFRKQVGSRAFPVVSLNALP